MFLLILNLSKSSHAFRSSSSIVRRANDFFIFKFPFRSTWLLNSFIREEKSFFVVVHDATFFMFFFCCKKNINFSDLL